jgi:23S rRNA (adenine2503-C2)-methyltransferase
MIDLRELSAEELGRFMAELGQKPFRARQIMKWLYKFGAIDLAGMTDLSKAFRAELGRKAHVGRLETEDIVRSSDGSQKFLWKLADGGRVESVLIQERGHGTLCVSSQVGCAMGCRFCRTAGMGLQRNLTQAEILGQVIEVRRTLEDPDYLTNLVFMGMGEPLANRANVVRAIHILTEPGLVGLSRRHLSLSTVGLASQLPLLARDVTLGLTVSLNAADDRTRDRLMPINRQYPMAELHRALAAFPLPHRRRITIAYVLLAGVNDSVDDARRLAKYLHGLKVKVNLIPFNPFPGAEFDTPDQRDVEAFQQVLVDKNLTAIVRWSKGRDVGAACGQLAGRAGDGGG